MYLSSCHSPESFQDKNPVFLHYFALLASWVPACAGMAVLKVLFWTAFIKYRNLIRNPDKPVQKPLNSRSSYLGKRLLGLSWTVLKPFGIKLNKDYRIWNI